MAELTTAEQIAQRAFDLNLLDERQLQDIWGAFGRRNVPVDEFVQFLLRRELLTSFQLDRLLKNERGGYFYGDYKVLYMLAGGSFARVYRAVHKDTKVVRAVKVLRKRYSDNPAQTDHFCREGMVGKSLRHANIVPIFEVFSKGMTHFLVMEFVEGRNLREFIKVRKKIDPIEATRLMIDMAGGLRYAVEHGVSHRDLKLTNILISSKGQAKLVDFGLASTDAAFTEETAEGLNQRTIDYAGLERATGVRKDDLRSDIYFLGVIYYHMLQGKSPLQETRDRIQRLSKSRFFDVVPVHQAIPDLPRVVVQVINQAMDLDPSRRYQTPAQLLVDLNIASERLAAGDDQAGPLVDPSEAEYRKWQAERERLTTALATDAQRHSVMIVESSTRMQDSFRQNLKNAGFRVLVTSDPRRALAQFEGDKKPAECVMFSTGQLGESSVSAFNEFTAGEQTNQVPALLLLGPNHHDWTGKARPDLAPHQLVLSMPIATKDLLDTVARLLPSVPAA
ncbi:MAG TPA: serine/threonine-protein kinase [Pirellulales bacterium]|nr:serine/threonine-protein kinase [Pirellulales bacterium]